MHECAMPERMHECTIPAKAGISLPAFPQSGNPLTVIPAQAGIQNAGVGRLVYIPQKKTKKLVIPAKAGIQCR